MTAPDADLRSFMARLETRGLLHRIARPVSVQHEMTEIHRRVIATGGPALLFEHPVDTAGRTLSTPVLANLFGTSERIALGLGLEPEGLEDLGEMLAFLRQPEAPAGLKAAMRQWPTLRAALAMGTQKQARPPAQHSVRRGAEIDLGEMPIQWCWPGEPGPLVTWPLVITRAPDDPRDVNVGVYRMQVLGRDRLLVRWLENRGGARHFRQWQRAGAAEMPIAFAIGADPATMLAAVMPLPDGMSELAFAGVLRGR